MFGRHAVAAAHPLAADAGLAMLRAGGSAIDAAVAVQMVLGLVEPQSSGLGGGAFVLHADARGTVHAYDGRETAPAGVDEALFLRPDGTPLAFHDAAVGGRAVGVPGLVAVLELAHRRHGRLPWARLFEPAIALAEDGFAVTPRLATLLAGDAHLRRDSAAAAFYYRADGSAWPVGHRLRNPALAAVLRRLAAEGAGAFYRGPVAESMVRKVSGHAGNPGRLSLADLDGYRAVEREALCSDWRRWRLCGMGPPSSGHLALMQVLRLYDAAPGPQPAPFAVEATDPAAALSASPEAIHRYTEAARLAFADRALWLADPDFTTAPAGRWTSLLDGAYLAGRARLIGPRSMGTAAPGRPLGDMSSRAPQAADTEAGTSHLSVIDAEGRAVVMTTTIEDAFGARQLVDGGTGLAGGFLLNNQLTDFAFSPRDAEGRPVANRVQPGKRPRSSMSPTLVFAPVPAAVRAAEPAVGAAASPAGPVLLAGSAGGAFIIHHTAKLLLATLAWGLPLQAAADLPHFASLNGPTLLEAGRHPPATAAALRERGHEVREVPITSGVHALQRTPRGWIGAADPRREGVVRGD